MVLSKSVLVVWFVVVAAQAAGAQQSPMPAEIAAKLQELGRVIDPPQTGQVYAPLQEKEPYQDVKVERDAKYGAADRNLLDIFMPAAASSPRPVLIFVHGGGLRAGQQTCPGHPVQ
jgi:acetyl esterase/lipase